MDQILNAPEGSEGLTGLPVEIIDAIFHCLQRDVRALVALSSTCRCLRARYTVSAPLWRLLLFETKWRRTPRFPDIVPGALTETEFKRAFMERWEDRSLTRSRVRKALLTLIDTSFTHLQVQEDSSAEDGFGDRDRAWIDGDVSADIRLAELESKYSLHLPEDVYELMRCFQSHTDRSDQQNYLFRSTEHTRGYRLLPLEEIQAIHDAAPEDQSFYTPEAWRLELEEMGEDFRLTEESALWMPLFALKDPSANFGILFVDLDPPRPGSAASRMYQLNTFSGIQYGESPVWETISPSVLDFLEACAREAATNPSAYHSTPLLRFMAM
ncbi:uncharacterized protein BJ171DRAFT_518992 [Polychytrium aggregatum]|uniref:uncharacterized protein n=1 Tax=Polychytrium aggregatum TaxID=110093 RepID=UPI0022FE44BE|nr:uncharacterized protein BJ171DRAFT_518992 [Polychytrium aggregatum]KAI9199385.1 hypothetical protein BJ171DRAFT_518992 [Polychytrium aggregatum]